MKKTKNASHANVLKEVCDYLGQDLNSPQCEALRKHLRACPECDVYFDTIKKTILMYREAEKKCTLPMRVKSNLYKTLQLKTNR